MNLTVTLTDAQLADLAEHVAALLPPNDRREWFTVEEAADYLRCSRQRVYDLRSCGRLPKTGDGSRVLVRRADLAAYLAGE